MRKTPESKPFLNLNSSTLYRELVAEHRQLLSYKWLESERAGHDIGYDRALLNWVCRHRDNWRSHYLKKHQQHTP